VGFAPRRLEDPLTREAELMGLLRGIATRRGPALVHLLEQDLMIGLDEESKVRLQLLVADELLEAGLDASQEHTSYGRLLEEIIDMIGRLNQPSHPGL